MAITTTYIVQPFVEERGRLKPSQAEKARTEVEAARKAERMMQRAAGVLVLSEESDAKADLYGEPLFVARYGRVPEEAVEALAA